MRIFETSCFWSLTYTFEIYSNLLEWPNFYEARLIVFFTNVLSSGSADMIMMHALVGKEAYSGI